MKSSRIISTGSYLPSRVISNDELAKTMDTSDQWIYSRTGIKQRHIADDSQATSDLVAFAIEDALNNAGIARESIDGIIVATTTPDVIFPSTAALAQQKAGLGNGFAYDTNAVCSGFLYAFIQADALIRAGQAKRVIVVGAEIMSRILDWGDRSTCVLFGDGAGAVVLEGYEGDGLLAGSMACDGALANILHTPKDAKLFMDGREVYKNAVEKMTKTIKQLCDKATLAIEDIDWFVAHQANVRILEAVAGRLEIPAGKVVITVDKHANTSAASIPLAFDHLAKTGNLKRGQNVAFAAVGAGLTWGGAIFKY